MYVFHDLGWCNCFHIYTAAFFCTCSAVAVDETVRRGYFASVSLFGNTLVSECVCSFIFFSSGPCAVFHSLINIAHLS